MFKRTFGNHFRSLTDVRQVSDPWKIGFTVGILRSDHQDWENWTRENRGSSNLAEIISRVGMKAVIAQSLNRPEAEPKKGFRQKKKASAAKPIDAADVQRKIIENAVDAIPADELMGSKLDEGLNGLKPGVALVLMRDGWSGVLNDETGAALEFSLENRLKFLGWRGFHVVVPANSGFGSAAGEHFLSEREFKELDATSNVAKAINGGQAVVTEYHGNARDDNGKVLFVDEDKEFGPAPVGDAITSWILEESREGQEYMDRFATETAADLGDTPSGDSATSAG